MCRRTTAAGETYDGGGGVDTLSIHTSADFTGSTMQSLEVLSLASSVVFTSDQLDLATDTPTGHGLEPVGDGWGGCRPDHGECGDGAADGDLSGWEFPRPLRGMRCGIRAAGDQIVINGGGLGVALTLTGSSQHDAITGGTVGDTLTGGLGVDGSMRVGCGHAGCAGERLGGWRDL